jgi:hypothetical protein
MQDSLLQWFAQRFLERRLQPRELLSARKFVYIGLILVLLFGSFLWRRYSIEPQAARLAILEQNQGDVELSGSLVQLIMTGSRGMVTCGLWMFAIESQKKNQWNELEFYVNALTKLQPHFVTPWLFQSWNLAYNVSVESDRPFDKYFYIARGVQLLAEGERKNRNIPEMRFYVGFYMQHKIGISDETNVMRSLLQLSMIPPNERDPARFRSVKEGRTEINWAELENFCRNHPKLARRLSVGIRREEEREQKRQFTCLAATDLLDFLGDSWRVPSVYQEVSMTPSGAAWVKKDDLLVPISQRFPPLPPDDPRRAEPPQERFAPADGFQELTDRDTLTDAVDCQALARAWYGYAQEPIPKPDDLIPGLATQPVDPHRQRKPKQMSVVLFRQYPALTQTHLCQNLQQEGWFDDDPWKIPNWFEPNGDRFSNGETATIRVHKADASEAQWDACARMWRKHGEANRLLFRDPVEETNLLAKAERYWENDWEGNKIPRLGDPLRLDPTKELKIEERERLGPEQQRALLIEKTLKKLSPERQEEFKAALVIYELTVYRGISNFQHHYYTSRVEGERDTIVARKQFAQATMLRYQASPERAMLIYLAPNSMLAWRDKVLSWPDYTTHREYRNDTTIQEETMETQVDYGLLKDQYEQDIKQHILRNFASYALVAQNAQAHAGMFSPVPVSLGLGMAQSKAPLGHDFFPLLFMVPVLDGEKLPMVLPFFLGMNAGGSNPAAVASQLTALNRPLIPDAIMRMVLERRKIIPATPAPQPGTRPPGGGPPLTSGQPSGPPKQ